MAERDLLAERFEEHRFHMRAVAYRMLGSLAEADDALQETWLRLSRTDASEIENLGGWLRQVVSRISLDMLRSRKARREDSIDAPDASSLAAHLDLADPEKEAVMADEVGLALLVVMEMLEPAERLAFVLHDMFAVPFDEIAPIVGRTPIATRQLASRARRRIHGAGMADKESGQVEASSPRRTTRRPGDLVQQRAVVDAFLAAARAGDMNGVLAVLAPDVVYRTPTSSGPQEVRGAEFVAPLTLRGRAVAARPLLINGSVGVVVAPRGRLLMILDFTVRDGKVVVIEAISDPKLVAEMELVVLDD